MAIVTMTFKLPLGLGTVNCYLLGSGADRVLIDTGPARSRSSLEWGLSDADCQPGDLSLVILTHGDMDHAGSCKYLRKEYGAKIGMSEVEAPAVATGDMMAVRSGVSSGQRRLARIGGPLVNLRKADRFEPDITFADGDELKKYGIDAMVVHTPGHSAGSLSVLTKAGNLFCGDLLENTKGPRPGSIVDVADEQAASIARLEELGAKTVYPGHGEPFAIEELE
jgi:glyoxylase-like metal-dependent hydrolase (beta-lactamase superfamily II)